MYSTAKITSVADEFDEVTMEITPFTETLVFARLDWSPLEVETLAALTVSVPFLRVAVTVPLALLM